MSTISRVPTRGITSLAVAGAISAGLVGCGGGHHLAEYPFSSRTLAVVYIAPPSPELLTSYYDLTNSQNPLEAVVRAGADVAREREGRRANARLDSAADRIDIPAVLAQRTLARASRYLGTRPSTDENQADYLMEVRMERFGINAKADEAAYLFTFAEAVLIDRRTGREIWNVNVHGRDRLTPYVESTSRIPGSVITAGTLGSVSVADFQGALNQLMDYSSNLITDELRAALRDVRNK
ncbi:MAG TPA: hypothetical protein VFP77_05855 [Gemmatimonadaceae bacterium]|jgi:hypothetical protein|nr:hypothetical protein [Gemmatimonadaceae bacterium]